MKKISFAIVAALVALPLGACTKSTAPLNRGLATNRLPEVSVEKVTHTVNFSGSQLATGEEAALAAFITSVGPAFADRLTLEDSNPANASGRTNAINKVLGKYGVRLSGISRATDVTPNSARLVLTRASVAMDDCPDWSNEFKVNFNAATSTNFGCAARSNLAKMVADPADLLEGRPLENGNAASIARPVARYDSHQPTGEPSGSLPTWNGDGPAKSGGPY